MKTVKRDYALNDKQLMCAPIRSKVGQEYLVVLATFPVPLLNY